MRMSLGMLLEDCDLGKAQQLVSLRLGELGGHEIHVERAKIIN
jgi:hypothetical protein